jgi:hypothetical protein
MSVESSSGLVSWTPAAGQDGQYEIHLSVSDSVHTTVQTFSLRVYPGLDIKILNPADGRKVRGALNITGTVKGPPGLKVEFSIDGGSWRTLAGVSQSGNWSCYIDTTQLTNALHSFRVRAVQGTDVSRIDTVTFNAENRSDIGTNVDSLWLLIAVVAIVTLLMAGILIRHWVRHRDSGDEYF